MLKAERLPAGVHYRRLVEGMICVTLSMVTMGVVPVYEFFSVPG